MLNYAIKRVFASIITIFFIATVTFFIMHAVPGDPLMGAKATSEEIRANLMSKYGLDQPLFIQYKTFIGNMIHGDFGISFTQKNRSVNEIIAETFPISALLGILALGYATLGGVVFGALTAKYRNRWPDTVIMLLVISGISLPSFVVAQGLIMGFGYLARTYHFTLLETAVRGDFNILNFKEVTIYLTLPALALGLYEMAYLTRLMRSNMLEVANTDYIRTAHAKGLSPLRIFGLHELRNAILPVVTVLGPGIAAITTGSFVVEGMFFVPGLGRHFVQSVQQLDYTAIMGLTVFYGSFLVIMVLIVDLLYGLIDPRIRVQT